ncbi:MAG TPA: GTPase HflX [Clostridiales bacterium]|nr:GTPase HflX [Clostridiales bacterium]
MEGFETNERQTALLVSVDTGEFDAETSINELAELASTAGAEVRGMVIQKRKSPDTATCIGAGRLQEIAEIVAANEIDLIIFDRELSASQIRNIEDATNCSVIDRTMLILDIFASRARSAEGRLQVELAQLEYLLPRLSGKGIDLSRLGGGIGTRGPGETKLETDRRHIRWRIKKLKEELAEIERRREKVRFRRKKDGVNTVALVGYTNAGKSTLMNALTNAGVLAENKLFATLDPTARALKLPDGRQVLLIDTVGFVRRLPHQLVDAFRSTLEEAAQADVILNICDASSPEFLEHLEVTNSVLSQIGFSGRPVIPVLNKCDIAPADVAGSIPHAVRISALTGEGLPDLLSAISAAMPPDRKKVTLLFPYNKGNLAQQCRQEGAVEKEEFTPEGILMSATIGSRLLELFRDYIVE